MYVYIYIYIYIYIYVCMYVCMYIYMHAGRQAGSNRLGGYWLLQIANCLSKINEIFVPQTQ